MTEYLSRTLSCTKCDAKKAEFTLQIDDKFSYLCEECVGKVIYERCPWMPKGLAVDMLITLFNSIHK